VQSIVDLAKYLKDFLVFVRGDKDSIVTDRDNRLVADLFGRQPNPSSMLCVLRSIVQ